MIVARYKGTGNFPGLISGKDYQVLAVDIPRPGKLWIRIVDSSEEDYLYPVEHFDVIQGYEDLLRTTDGKSRCEIPL